MGEGSVKLFFLVEFALEIIHNRQLHVFFIFVYLFIQPFLVRRV